MKIEILCTDGSPLGVTSKTVWGDTWRIGVGGAELALITMCEEWTKVGYEVVLYNTPNDPKASEFEQRPRHMFDPHDNRDVLIVFRTPNPLALIAKGLKVWWSCDQFTSVDFNEFHKQVDKVVLISDFHAKYFKDNYNITDTQVIDLPVRFEEYFAKHIQKIKGRMMFTSVPDRGLDNLWRMWDNIKKGIPEASLVITSDHRLWGATDTVSNQHRSKWLIKDDFRFLGAISRENLIKEQLQSELFVYPCNYNELFCIACSEAQMAGAYPITSDIGALHTTNMGTLVPLNANDPRNDALFIENVIDAYNNDLIKNRDRVMGRAKQRFHPKTILNQWDELVFNG